MCIQACPKVVTSHLCETSSVAAGEASWPASTHCFNTFSLSEGRWSFSNSTTGDKKSQAQQWQLWEREAREWPQKSTKGARGSFQKGGDSGLKVVCGPELPNPPQQLDKWPLGHLLSLRPPCITQDTGWALFAWTSRKSQPYLVNTTLLIVN